MLVERIKEYLRVQRTTEDSKLEVSNHAVDSVDNDLVESISTLSLNHTSSMATITELLKDEKKLKIEDCKAYMRKHGLRLAGTKQVLIDRIKEHVRIMDDQGMVLYPESTFIINCQGDACVGDVVLFKQRVYDLFNLGGRCSVGPAVGVRSVAGRIVNESYGSAKQQHTFTIEVLWSKGDRPLPPLYPLIIKGRNLYRIKTLRQAWADESERKRKLEEKHARGAQARMERRARISGNKIDNIRPMMCNANNVPGWQEKDVVSSIVLRFKSVLAGLIVGKHLKNLNELRAVSHAQVDVDRDPEDPAHCVVKITGTEHQRQVAISMLNAKTLCRFFANKGNCSNGEQCSFRHHSL
ncbi:hypothetical protein KP509_29G014600 [Ceratopteris richardii]|nr:hypothetical protein KP509_29G014600 [Ceratopteris richardii]